MAKQTYDHVSAITFDAGWTLIYPHPSVGEIYADGLARHGGHADPDVLNERFREVYREIAGQHRDDISPEAERRIWRRIVESTLARDCPAEKLDTVFNDIYNRFATAECWRIFDGACETVQALKSRGYPVYLLSNADPRFRSVFQDLGIDRLFQAMFISSEIGFEKPHPGIFEHVENTTGHRPGELLHIGDSDFHDGGARTRGWSVCILGQEIDCLNDLLDLLP